MSKTNNKTKITRITASDSKKESKKAKKPEATKSTVSAKKTKEKTQKSKKSKKEATLKVDKKLGFFGSIGSYFLNSYRELRQVRWPNARETWGMTVALIGFTMFFVLFISLLDAGFKYLFNLILGGS